MRPAGCWAVWKLGEAGDGGDRGRRGEREDIRREGRKKRRVVYVSWIMRAVIRGMESHEQRWRELKK